MKKPRPIKRPAVADLPEIQTGSWTGEIFGKCQLHFGQVLQPPPFNQTVEFTYLISPACFRPADKSYTWPGSIMIGVPTPRKTVFRDAGFIMRNDLLGTLFLTLEVTRAQFSDMLPLFEKKQLKELYFSVITAAKRELRVRSWGMSTEL